MESQPETIPLVTASQPSTKQEQGFNYVVAGILLVFALMVMIGIWYFSRPDRGSDNIQRPHISQAKYASRHRYVPAQQWLEIAQDHPRVYYNQTEEPMDPSAARDAVACQRLGNTVWDNTRQLCSCREPFTGSFCEHERYDPNYRFAGFVEDCDLVTEINFATPISVDRLSYTGTATGTVTGPGNGGDLTCTQACDADPTCSGVIWKSAPPLRGSNIDNCVLLHEAPVMGRNQAINLPTLMGEGSNHRSAIPHELFLKPGRRPHYLDRVILHNRYQPEDLPDRWFLVDAYNDGFIIMTTAYEETPKHLNMIPLNAINDGSLVGVFSRKPLEVATAKAIINNNEQSPDWVVRTPGQPLDLPTTWDDLWVVYVRDPRWLPPTMLRGGLLGFGVGGGAPVSDATIVYRLPRGQSLPPNWFEMTAYRNPQTGFQIQRIQPDLPTRVDFAPTQQQTIGIPRYAVWSSQPMTLEEARQALNQAQRTQNFTWQDLGKDSVRQWYISCPGQRFSLPLSLASRASQGIYVTYLNEN